VRVGSNLTHGFPKGMKFGAVFTGRVRCGRVGRGTERIGDLSCAGVKPCARFPGRDIGAERRGNVSCGDVMNGTVWKGHIAFVKATSGVRSPARGVPRKGFW